MLFSLSADKEPVEEVDKPHSVEVRRGGAYLCFIVFHLFEEDLCFLLPCEHSQKVDDLCVEHLALVSHHASK